MEYQTLVIGSRGRLANSLRQLVDSNDFELNFIGKEIEVGDPNYQNKVVANLLRNINERGTKKISILLLSAIIDPSQNKSLITQVNLETPKRLVDALIKQDLRPKLITIGSVMEAIYSTNAYVSSKQQLSAWLSENLDQRDFAHIRFPTLVGNTPPPSHMYLFQLASAVANHSEFRMSSGLQYRQYHNYSDAVQQIAAALVRIHLDMSTGVVDPPYAKPVLLRELAIQAKERFSPNLKLNFDRALDPEQDFYSIDEMLQGKQTLLESSLEIGLNAISHWIQHKLL